MLEQVASIRIVFHATANFNNGRLLVGRDRNTMKQLIKTALCLTTYWHIVVYLPTERPTYDYEIPTR